MTKHSKQRDAVYAELCSRKDHPTAEDLYLALKKEIPSISLATVYRNLSLMEGDGKILKFTVDGTERFDADMSEHYHLVCLQCKKVSDLFPDLPLPAYTFKGFGGKILSQITLFKGFCEDCRNVSGSSIQ